MVYSYYTNNTCTTAKAAAGTETVTNGTVPNSTTITFNTVGTFYWQAVYSGDTNNNGATSSCTPGNNEQLSVIKAAPTIATTLSADNIRSAHGTAKIPQR